MIRIYSDDKKDKGSKYDMKDDTFYLLEYKRDMNERIIIKGICQRSWENIRSEEVRRILGNFYWYWNDYLVFELTEDEVLAIKSMEELVS